MGQKFHTEFRYTDSIHKNISIQNSYPKGGQSYTDGDGKEYVFAIFWTCLTNKTDSDLNLIIDFPTESFTIPSSPNVYFNLYVPMEAMSLKKEPLLNYGFDLKSFLDDNIEKPSKLQTTISPNNPYLFYVVVLTNKGVNGTLRAGFELQDQELIYKINGHQINCGRIEINN